jgi:hypothetical protein
MSAHAIYRGQVGHQRLKPKPHGLHYDIQYFWLDLGALAELPPQIQRESFGAFSLRRRDYFQGCAAVAGIADLAEAARVRAAALGADISDIDQVFLLSPLANWGVYFSPLTQYYLYRQGQPSYLLAEVSNTPWNERHHYLVPLGADGVTEFSHAKNFHVSPFNPLDMQYYWRIAAPATQFNLLLQNSRLGEKVFSAWFRLQREALDAHSIRRMLIRQPWQNVQVVIRIYWQALKLLVKGLPFYSHQKPKDQSV